MTGTIIEVKNLKKEYRIEGMIVPVLKGISFKIKKGEFVAITGASGSGKTTIFNLIGLIDAPTSGKVYIDGVDTSEFDDVKKTDFRLEKIGRVFQFFNLLSELTVVENVMLPMLLRKVNDKVAYKRAVALLRFVGIGGGYEHRSTHISGGQTQMVAVARALANEPVILLADEPTGNLDSKSAQQIIDMFRNINIKQGQTVIMITHEKNLANQADRIIQISDGRVMEKEEITLEFIESKIADMIIGIRNTIKELSLTKGKEEWIARLRKIRTSANEIKYLDLLDEAFSEETKKFLCSYLKKSHDMVARNMKQESVIDANLDRICDEIAESCNELINDRKFMEWEDFRNNSAPQLKRIESLVKRLRELDTKRELVIKKVRRKIAEMIK